ncbi:MAG: penicillin acylase family protein, partial [Actinobacteria bacterium]
MRGTAIALVVAITGIAATAARADVVQPYGTHDAGGFRNILPAGEAGTDNALQLGVFQGTGTRPAHWDDQLPLYANLLYASPHLKHSQIASFYKDATFGVKASDVESKETLNGGHTVIVRDKPFGVPHIYGDSDLAVEWGAGYAAAEDRLFLIDVLRHAARAQLSSFAGGSAGNRAMDRTQWGIAPYNESDLQKQIDLAPTVYGALGAQIVARGTAFVNGINAYINAAMLNPTLMPAEYAAFGTTPQQWNLRDVIAEASLIGGIFGKGGGNELHSALFLQALEKRFGTRHGRRAWTDFRSKNDPEAPTTVLGQRFPYETASAFSKRGLALPDPGSLRFTPVAPPVSTSSASAASAQSLRVNVPNDGSIGSGLLRALANPHASNWELVSARHSRTGHPIGVLGPQVGYYDPEILMEEDLHGPHFDARGATFPGVNLMVQLGHGRDYSWSATTATSDNVDTFAEVLCGDAFHYMWRGHCRAMEKLVRNNSWAPSVGSQVGPGSETLTAYRTVHGIVYARGTVHHKKVAFVSARTTYFHEADSAIGLYRLNDPTFMHGPQSFRQAANGINFGFNWSYIDPNHIAYQLSGWFPKRALGTSPDFPVLGTGPYDWQGYDPNLHTMKTMSMNARPHAVDPAYLVSWNNKQAPGWAAADDKYSYGPIFRSQMIEDRVKHAIRGGRKMGLEQLVSAMDEPASQDLEAWSLMPILRRALGRPADRRLRSAITLLSRWAAAGAHRRDLNRNGVDEDTRAITLMDAWWPRLVAAEFQHAIGSTAYRDLFGILPPASVLPGDSPTAPDYDDGWWGYVSKDLRDMFSPGHVRGKFSHHYCGRGSQRRCRAALRQSLLRALGV